MRPIERPLRLLTGLILFAYATSHLLNHAFGIRSVAAMEAASAILLAPWQTAVGLTVLYGSFFVHGGLGLYALFRRRHLRIPAAESWQLALGLLIPLLLIPHAAAVRLGSALFGLDFGYERILHHFFVLAPGLDLPRQFLLLTVVWLHGCLGVRAWLISKPWYPRAVPLLAALATLVPALALAGLVGIGLNLREAVAADPAYAATLEPQPAHAQSEATRERIAEGLSIGYLALVLMVLAARMMRDWHARRFRAVRITYPGPRPVAVAPGFSVLEASRWAGIPHASVCGGRGRCSTCRVRVTEGAAAVAAPQPIERRTLARIGAAPDVRLACQVRPRFDITVAPLVPVSRAAAGAARFDAAVEGGRELEIAALFVDLRESTRWATGRLPYDALFLFDRYIQAVTGAVRRHAGQVTSIAGDGVMSVFGIDPGAHAAGDALRAALAAWDALEELNRELAGELEAPLRAGMGLHVGLSVVGRIAAGGSLQFLGDTGNVAAKLEAEAKRLDGTVVVSWQALALAAPATADVKAAGIETHSVTVPGRREPVAVVVFRDRERLRRLLAPPG